MFTKTSGLKTPASHMSLHTVKSFFMMLFKCWHLIYMHAWCFHISLITDSADDLTAETSLSCRYQSNTVLKISSAETADMWDGLLSHSPTLPGFPRETSRHRNSPEFLSINGKFSHLVHHNNSSWRLLFRLNSSSSESERRTENREEKEILKGQSIKFIPERLIILSCFLGERFANYYFHSMKSHQRTKQSLWN